MTGRVYQALRPGINGLGFPLHTLPQAQVGKSRVYGRFANTIPDRTMFGGLYRIAGTVKVISTPASRRVRLHDQPTGICVRDVIAGSDGRYEFKWIAAGVYYVVAFDQPGGYVATIEDRVTPALVT